ncbi:hypothetical protein HMPREF1050_0950 [Haemophilus parahaemolyticus HK385]|uniref:Uncharacterized protein n=1 Tax=Haemophilus parahaemolyticus HK385 TaxID=1095744 RepID=A0ABP2P1Q7_HAEPH|nr:hypothetical protein HMPREF1050_0950 [Haemophilus parahaemolyticus HK385]
MLKTIWIFNYYASLVNLKRSDLKIFCKSQELFPILGFGLANLFQIGV